MIQILKDYYDKNGNVYKVLSFEGGKYLCQSYKTGRTCYMRSNELVDKKDNKTVIEPVYKKISPVVKEIKEEEKTIVEEPKIKAEETKTVKKSSSTVKKTTKKKTEEKIQDNVKETADDFYADL